MRSLAVTLALVAMSAQAQEAASTPEGEEKPAPNAPAPAAEAEQSQAVVASIEPAGSQPPAASAARSDAGTGAEAQREPTDCGLQGSMLADADPPVAVSSYTRKVLDRPQVFGVGRCFRKAILQVKSQSKEPWVIKSARVEGPGGEVLKVTGIRSRPLANDKTISVIVAERATGEPLTPQMMLTLHLSAEDGRVALLQEPLP